VTDATGQIQFTATDTVPESITYTAVDTTDSLPVPGSASVTFTGANISCIAAPPTAAAGFALTPWATGFTAENFFYSDVSWGGCPGAVNPTFDSFGSALVAEFSTGNLYKLGLAGGAVTSGNSLASIGQTIGQPVFGRDGSLYATHGATGGGASTGDVVQIDPNTGAMVKVLVSGLPCPGPLAVDPLSGDLFFASICFGGVNSSALSRIVNPSSASPTLTTYATLPSTPNGAISFAPDGTMFVVSGYNGPKSIVQVAGTNKPAPPAMTTLSGINSDFWVTVGTYQASGAANSLIVNYGGVLQSVNITSSPFTTTNLADGPALSSGVIGPNGCLYSTTSDTIYELAPSSGGCGTSTPAPTLTLSPATVSPNPAQGTTTTFTATLTNVSTPQGTPITLHVIGPNLQLILVRSDASGHATFTYTGVFTGTDVVVAAAPVGSQSVTSNQVNVTWTAGAHTTFLSLNQGVSSGQPNALMTVIGTLVDVSAFPPTPVSNATIAFTLTGQTCVGTTNSSGTASCSVTPTGAVGPYSLTASFGGTPGTLLPSSANKAVDLLQPLLVGPPTLTAPTFSKVFTPSTVSIGGSSTLTFTITNSNSVGLTSLAFSDTLPAGLAFSGGITNSGCAFSDTLTSSSFSISGGGMDANGTCTISLGVTASSAGLKNNTTSTLTSIAPTAAAATASINVIEPYAPTFTKTFGAAASIFASQTTTLTFTIGNSNPVALTGMAFSDTLPVGLVMGNAPGIANTCGGTVTAVAGSSSISLAGGTIPASSTCTITVTVAGISPGTQNNVTSTLTSNEADPADPAAASILVYPTLDGSFQVSYAANPSVGESYINIINTGANGASLVGPGFGGTTGNICVNVYAFAPDEQEISCCSCLLTPNSVANLGVNRDLTSTTLTGLVPASVVVKLVSTLAGGNGTGTSCSSTAATEGTLANGLVAYGTTPQPAGSAFSAVEHTFIPSTLSAAEYASITGRCASILGNGSGFGVCNSCRSGALGAANR
jgi:uncharacterized repeat protein (TIGR01451 family)